MSNKITIEDVLESAEANNGRVLDWHPSKYNDNMEKNKGKSVYDCTWIKIQFVDKNGKKRYPNFKFLHQITGSGAKLPPQAG